jgi:uncharacterized membrane protein
MAVMPSSRPVRIALVISLALNLIAAGLVAGLVAGRPGERMRGPDSGLGPIAEAFGPEERRALLRDLRARRDIRPPDRALHDATRAALVEALRTDPFDRDRARSAIEQHAARVEAAEAAMREALVERLAAMTPEERAALAARLESRRRAR